MQTAQYITGAKLPAIQDLYNRHVRGTPITLSETPVTQVIDCAKSMTKRLNSFYRQAIRLLNNSENCHHTIYIDPPPFCTLLLLAGWLLHMLSHSASTYMYRLPQLACTPAP